MNIQEAHMKKTCRALGAIALILGLGACGHDLATAPNSTTTGALASDHAMAGAAGQMTALYDGQEFTVNMFELSESGRAVGREGIRKILDCPPALLRVVFVAATE